MKILYFIFFIIQNSIGKKILKIPFKRKIELELNETNLIENLYKNKIYTEIEIGNPSQKFKSYFKLQQFPTFIISIDNKDAKCDKFNQNKSNTFKFLDEISSYITYINLDFKHGRLSKDDLYLNNKEIYFENFKFFLAKDLIDEVKTFSSEIGLKISTSNYNVNKTVNFIYELIENKFIDYYIFYFKFNEKNDNEGELIIGDYYHNIENKFTEKNYIYNKIPIIDNQLIWGFNHNYLYIKNEKIIDELLFIYFQIEFNFIHSIEEYYNEIKEKFFDKFKNKCFEKNFTVNYIKNKKIAYFVCDNSVDIKNFPELIIENIDMKYNFTFTYQDLFYNYNNKNYFLVVFQKPFKFEKKDWIFGKPFFKKYLTIFDGEKKVIGIYDKNIGKTNFNWSWIIVIILGIILIVTCIYFKYYQSITKRKLRANELEDEYDYVSHIPQEQK